MKIEKLNVVIALVSGLVCFGLLIGVPVWALFFGMAWYFVLGATGQVIKQALPAMVLGYLLAAVAIVLYTASKGEILVVAIAVGATVYIMLLMIKLKLFSCSLAAFNAYSCLFAGYYAGNFPKMEPSILWDLNNVAICILWTALANVIGLLCGYVSVRFGSRTAA